MKKFILSIFFIVALITPIFLVDNTESSVVITDVYSRGYNVGVTLKDIKRSLKSNCKFIAFNNLGERITNQNKPLGTNSKIFFDADYIVCENYRYENGFSIFVLGDVDSDGKISSSDYIFIRQIILTITSTNDINVIKSADLNRDGKINTSDYIRVRRYLLGISSFVDNNVVIVKNTYVKGLYDNTLLANDAKSHNVIYGVPYIYQKIKYPTACESVSTVMALQYKNVDITPERYIDDYLDKGKRPTYQSDGKRVGCDPYKAFPGNPYSRNGMGCFPPVMMNAMNKFMSDDYIIMSYKGADLSTLVSTYIDNDCPIVFWGTTKMAKPKYSSSWYEEDTDRKIDWYYPMHCLLLIGYDSQYYYFNDPQEKAFQKYTKKDCEISFNGMGGQAIVII